MCKATLQTLGITDRMTDSLDFLGLSDLPFETRPTYPSLVKEFLVSYSLNLTVDTPEQPKYNCSFSLMGTRFTLPRDQFDAAFRFKSDNHVCV